MKRIKFKMEDIKRYLREQKERIKEKRRVSKERREEALEKRRNSEFGKKMAPIYQWMNRLSLPLHFVLSCVINFIIEAISRHSIVKAWNYMVFSPMTFLFNAYMIFSTYLIVYLVKSRVFTRIIITVLWLVIGIVNGYMLTVRVTPFNAQDLLVIDDALSMLDKYFTWWQVILLALAIVAVLVWLVAMCRWAGKYRGKMYRIPFLIATVLVFVTMGKVTDLAIENRIVSNYFGNIAFAYEDYGLPYCFSASLFHTGIDKPSGYSKKKVNQIIQNGKLTQSTSERDADDMPNIVVIQMESVFDTNELEFLQTSKDPIPTLHALMEKYSSGYFKVPSVGAGTANTEFEVLTGMSLRYFGPGEYPYKTKARYEPMESVATALKTFGYGAHALHNNGGNFYSRADVFQMMGFDSYTSLEFMNALEFTEEGWATDDILTQHILNAMDSTAKQDFVFGITVEGHGSYDHKLEHPEITVSGIEDEDERIKWEYFVNCIHGTDQFIADLIEELEKRGEPTVLVIYGDHLPTMGLKASDLKSRYLFNTNYVIWDNIGLEKQDRNIPAYQLMADVFGKLDIHSGTVFNYHQTRRQTKDYLIDLEMLQYDMLYGERYVYGGKENAPTMNIDFQMGIKDVELTGIEQKHDGTYALYGSNMTAASYVYVNGVKKGKPTFINDQRIETGRLSLEDGDVIVIKQLGTTNRVFRSSAEYVYQDGQLIRK